MVIFCHFDFRFLESFMTDYAPELKAMIEQLKEEYPEAEVHGHNEFSAKACPCFDVKEELANRLGTHCVPNLCFLPFIAMYVLEMTLT